MKCNWIFLFFEVPLLKFELFHAGGGLRRWSLRIIKIKGEMCPMKNNEKNL